jgi:hypothetical protein
MDEIKVGDHVEHLKQHMVGEVVGVGLDVVKVAFNGPKNVKKEPTFVMLNCKPSELRKV